MNPTTESVRDILEQISHNMRPIHEFSQGFKPTIAYRNPEMLYNAMKEYATYYAQVESVLKEWVRTYLQENRRYLFARLWLYHARKHLIHKFEKMNDKQFQYSVFNEEWPNAIPQSPSTSYEWAVNFVTTQIERQSIEHCADPKILQIHANKACTNNGWFCDMCEEMENKWHRKLLTEITESSNVILNESYHESFSTDFAKQDTYLPDEWAPPKFYGQNYTNSQPITTLQEFQKEVQRQRQVFLEDFKTKFQFWQDLQHVVTAHYTGWAMPSAKHFKDFEIFLFLWSRLDVVGGIMKQDMRRAESIWRM